MLTALMSVYYSKLRQCKKFRNEMSMRIPNIWLAGIRKSFTRSMKVAGVGK
jgi:hypothetical protein